MRTQSTEKWIEYAVKIQQAVMELFDEENTYHIDIKELEKSANATAFIHALATVIPARFYNQFTGDNVDFLEFNHIANSLCFKFSRPEQPEEEQSEDEQYIATDAMSNVPFE